jgi:hypothetical protein
VSPLKSVYPTIRTHNAAYSQMNSNLQALTLMIYRSVSCLNHAARADSSFFSGISMTSAAWTRFHTAYNFFDCFMLFTVVFNVDNELPTAMPGQHMFQYVHQLFPKYVTAFNK